jgi:hypothetical protein
MQNVYRLQTPFIFALHNLIKNLINEMHAIRTELLPTMAMINIVKGELYKSESSLHWLVFYNSKMKAHSLIEGSK